MRTAAFVAALFAAAPAFAWDTYVTARHDWRSVYENKYGGTGSFTAAFHDAKGNEHAEITDWTLFSISPELMQSFGTHATPTLPFAVDLNASLMRTELYGLDTAGDDLRTVLEERRLPPLSMWAGLPDFNYTLYDWVNKSTRCPALPLGADRYDLCHVYEAWLGAGLNSTHMGELAVKVYARHHAIAVAEGQRAAAMRALLRQGGRSGTLPPGQTWHEDYVREAETLALTYETIGQHFMQDRWSIGHTFSRWGPGTYGEILAGSEDGNVTLKAASLYGVVTGVVHGSLAVFGNPDPLSAPLVDYKNFRADEAKVMTFRYSIGNRLFGDPDRSAQNGLGDYLFADILDDGFDATVLQPVTNRGITRLDTVIPVKALHQKKGLSHCGAQGFRSVIASFDDEGGAYGQLRLTLPAPDPYASFSYATAKGGDPSTELECTDLWATNDSYYTAARTIAGATWLLGDGKINDIVVSIGKWSENQLDDTFVETISDAVKAEHGTFDQKPYTPSALRATVAIATVMWQSWKNKHRDEVSSTESIVRYGVQSAKDGIAFESNGLDWRGNGSYNVPEYYEPVDLDSLPWWSEERQMGSLPQGGMDRAALDGFFNRAHTEGFCKTMYGTEKSDPKKELTLKLLREKSFELEVSARNGDATAAPSAERYRAACGYLASRVYKSTEPKYPMSGSRFERIGEHLPFGVSPKYGASYEPICAYFDGPGGTAIRTSDASNDGKPYYLKPGYVAQPGKEGERGYAPESLENWCEMIPVLDVGVVPMGDPDAAGHIDHLDGDRWLKLKGENVGIKTSGGKVGSVIATDAMGTPRPLDIWDGVLQQTSGGWSYDNQTVWARIPGSKKGFPSDATASMTPEEIKKLAPRLYKFELTRPDDATAKAIYRANGAKTVGTYKVAVSTSWVENTGMRVNGYQKKTGVWVNYPAWSRPQTEVLLDGVYKVGPGGTYTKVDLAAYGITVEYRDGFEPMFDTDENVSWVPAPDKRGYTFSHPIGLPTSVFDGTASFFFAFH